MRLETSKNSIVSFKAETESDELLLGILSEMNVRIASYGGPSRKINELNLEFFRDA